MTRETRDRNAGMTVLAAAFLAATIGCAAARPPVPVQEAIRTIDRHLPAYVAEANKALAASDLPDKDRLIGIGERLARAVAALERWAGGDEAQAGDGTGDGNSQEAKPR